MNQQRQEFQEARQYERDRQGDIGAMGIRVPTAEMLHRQGECNHHFFGVDGGRPVRKILLNFVGKQQGRGKT